MSSRARGIRGHDSQWLPIEEAWHDLAERYPKLSLNDFLWILLDLGRWTWSRLPDGMRQQMLAPHKVFTKRQRQRMRMQARIGRVVSCCLGTSYDTTSPCAFGYFVSSRPSSALPTDVESRERQTRRQWSLGKPVDSCPCPEILDFGCSRQPVQAS